MATFGKIDEYDSQTDDWNEYVERLGHYFEANEITDQGMEMAAKEVHDIKGGDQLPRPVHKMREANRRNNAGRKCDRCGGSNHVSSQCYYKNAVCNNCNKVGHIQRACRSRSAMNDRSSGRGHSRGRDRGRCHGRGTHYKDNRSSTNHAYRIDDVSQEDENNEYGLFKVETQHAQNGLSGKRHRVEPYLIEVLVNGKKLTMEIDTCAATSVISSSTFHSVWKEGDDRPKLYDIGEFKGQKVTIDITSNVPRFYKHRNVAYALRQKVDDELECLEKQGIIKPVQYSDWAAPIVPVVKSNGNIRICGDYKLTVNKVARTNVYPIPRIEDLFASLSGGKTFTKLDLSQAYQQLTLDEESQKLTTINTHRCLYQYQRLPFGISAAPAVFQRTMECLLKVIPHVCVYLDDILVTRASEQEHLENMKELLSRLSKDGLRLNAQKCKFMVVSVEYLGHKIDAQGLHPLDEKVKAIASAPAPRNVAELKSLLGLVQYYQRFLPNLATTLAPLHRLLRKEVTWSWGAQQKKAFNMVKGHLSSCDLLTHYDPHKKLVLGCDASPYGVGAVLSHQSDDGEEKPIAFASRSLSQAEKNYSQLDREALAIIFGTKKFHQYIYGRSFTLLSDHKPLESIFSRDKDISQMASSRIQRWALTLSAYNYTIEYRKGTSLANADCMSRLPLPYTPPNPPLPGDTILLLEAMDASPVKSWQIKQWTDRDPTLSRVRNFLLSGWPSINLEESFTPFVKRKHELSVLDGCVLWGNRIVVPPQGREIVVNMLHEAHPGISRMKSVACGFVWWPKMDDELELKVKTCSVCQQSRPVQAEASLHFGEWPEHPWSRLHLDYAGPFLGIITERTGPVSFHVRLDNGSVVKRHIDHLRLRHVLTHESQHDKTVPSTHEQSVLPELPDKLPMLPEPGNIPVLPGSPHLQDEVTSTRPEPQQVLPEALSPTQSDSCGAQEFRRSSRIRKAPDRLNLKIAAEL
ncbi:uncharacterized protein K02A2.6-like [Haliotis rufescens]|uniref:uncharacterized protein K02A2.6-like n=1 Tax=Haliotis rufescens TaxID=6454 RepID=UPI00201E78A8|nr:uncharacterized protein K02A2.6-like [Haliotis rufescens]